jgi:DUF1009 family protein
MAQRRVLAAEGGEGGAAVLRRVAVVEEEARDGCSVPVASALRIGAGP